VVAFDDLRPVFSATELNRLGDTMAERGLRLRRGLDEAVDGWAEKGEKRIEEASSGEEDEIAYDARELRRLQPF
jgi:hypothetical protein